jgi:hypothetical protein
MLVLGLLVLRVRVSYKLQDGVMVRVRVRKRITIRVRGRVRVGARIIVFVSSRQGFCED